MLKIFKIDINMKILHLFGLAIVSVSALSLIGFSLYKFLEVFVVNSEIPLVIRWGSFGLILGAIIILISFIIERIKDSKKEK